MTKKIKELIAASDRICILAHDGEDADAAGSCNAMKYALLALGKKCECILSDKLEHRLEFMDEGFTVYNGESPIYDLCIALDCGDRERLGKRAGIFDAAKNTVCIDHHITNKGFADINIIDPKAPACGEILFELFRDMEIPMSRDIAKNLYAAISSDSGSFKYSNVRPKTMAVAAELLKYDINHAEIARRLYDTQTFDMLRFKGRLMRDIHQYADGRINVVSADEGLLAEYNIDERDTGGIIDIPRSVEGCEIAISIREYSDKIKVSFRSNGRYNVAKISEILGGGGHEMAAGAAIFGKTMAEAEEMIIKICEEAING